MNSRCLLRQQPDPAAAGGCAAAAPRTPPVADHTMISPSITHFSGRFALTASTISGSSGHRNARCASRSRPRPRPGTRWTGSRPLGLVTEGALRDSGHRLGQHRRDWRQDGQLHAGHLSPTASGRSAATREQSSSNRARQCWMRGWLAMSDSNLWCRMRSWTILRATAEHPMPSVVRS